VPPEPAARPTARACPFGAAQLLGENHEPFIKVTPTLRFIKTVTLSAIMNFQSIAPVETGDAYLDHALKEAGRRATLLKRSMRKGNSFLQFRHVERQRLAYVAEELERGLGRITDSFPSLDRLSEFYTALMDATLERERLKKDLAATAWAAATVKRLVREFERKIGTCQDKDELLAVKRHAIGRISSVVKQISKSLLRLEQCRRVMRTYPSLKDGLFTVAIAGFPNVGKSTLLGRLTTARPEIKNYAFTTTTLNVGYMTYRYNQLQFVDTPGSLARPEKMNNIEKQAYLAMKYAAHLIIYVYDLTETYPLKEQEELERLIREVGKETIIYVGKNDLVPEKRLMAFKKEKARTITSLGELKEKITAIFEKEFLGLK
jgi:nucleolar GTP-binding protein